MRPAGFGSLLPGSQFPTQFRHEHLTAAAEGARWLQQASVMPSNKLPAHCFDSGTFTLMFKFLMLFLLPVTPPFSSNAPAPWLALLLPAWHCPPIR
jgi:hypothetical protein